MSDAHRCAVRRALLLLGLLSGASLGSVAENWVERGAISPNDIPPGTYIALSMPPEVGGLESTRVRIDHHSDGSWAYLSFSDRNGTTQFQQRTYEIRSNMGSLKDRYDVSKCYYFHTSRKILKFLAETSSMREGTCFRGILLCTKKSSTKERPALTLYLDAARSSKERYAYLHLPVHLEPEATRDTAGPNRKEADSVAPSDDTHPPRKRMKVTEYKTIKDGFYADMSGETSARMWVETRSDGLQRANLTLQAGEASFLVLDALLVPAHIPDAFKLVQSGETTQSEYMVYLREKHQLIIGSPQQKLQFVEHNVDQAYGGIDDRNLNTRIESAARG
ncbi:hypothetical protein FOZ62_000502, partial [Perkinsus olseni]